MNARRYLKPGIAAAVLVAAGALGWLKLYEEPRQDKLASLDAQLRENAALERSLNDRIAVRNELREVGASTLGATADEVDARFRAMLQRIAQSSGLSGVQISTGRPADVPNPIGASRRRISGMPDMRRRVDFQVIRADVTGTGTLEQVLRTTAMLQVQPWVHRIESFAVQPEGRNQDRFSLRAGVSTIMLPVELLPRELEEPHIAGVPGETETAMIQIANKNPFREPPRRVAETPRRSSPSPAEPPPPTYNEWRLAGIVESRLGTEAILVNTRSDEGMSIGTGASIAGAKLVAAEGERAIFEIEGEEFEIFNGQTLEQRRPASR
jgi:hypothetical protein